MKLSQALAIMRKFRDNGHVDADLLDVFLKQRVFLRYAERFMDKSQLDVA